MFVLVVLKLLQFHGAKKHQHPLYFYCNTDTGIDQLPDTAAKYYRNLSYLNIFKRKAALRFGSFESYRHQ
jgi:hypothetical protein